MVFSYLLGLYLCREMSDAVVDWTGNGTAVMRTKEILRKHVEGLGRYSSQGAAALGGDTAHAQVSCPVAGGGELQLSSMGPHSRVLSLLCLCRQVYRPSCTRSGTDNMMIGL